jgi:NitT/TauT family transport system permease protein
MRRNVFHTLALPLLGLGMFHVGWYLATRGNGIADLPTPALAYHGLIELAAAGVLWKNLVASLFRVTWGLGLAIACGVPLGVLLGTRQAARAAMNGVVQVLRPISPIAWLPFATVLFGGVELRLGGRTVCDPADLAAIFVIFLAAFLLIVTATASATAGIETKYLRAAANFAVSRGELVRRVILPAAMPHVLAGLRLAVGVAWMVIVAAEMLGVTSGLGFQVSDARNGLRFDYVAAAMIVIGLTGLGLDRALAALERSELACRGIDPR